MQIYESNVQVFHLLPHKAIYCCIILCFACCYLKAGLCYLLWVRYFHHYIEGKHFGSNNTFDLHKTMKLDTLTENRCRASKVTNSTFTLTSIRVLPSSLMIGSTWKGRFTPSVIRYLHHINISWNSTNPLTHIIVTIQRYTYFHFLGHIMLLQFERPQTVINQCFCFKQQVFIIQTCLLCFSSN